ncbi:delta(14)-sterol reductase LBR isoform X1 [Oryzias melastigma]|uniref:Delta(14)-sterol reductase LBR n=2 Tax=Oryzias melastigma TaxID=30732 RepID=A0A3B3CMR0_ORYME|nr:delta(14)-sterol reductase LBR isoform X1 [Oryzias melastigma]XP_024119779.1 delta(14)-sterol reductase LBR isoform X1 [Oryzias melastigma]
MWVQPAGRGSEKWMPTSRFQRGDSVMGRWPGSSLYYEVKVLSFDGASRQYTVVYKDGTELELKEQDIMNISSFQHRSRSRSRSPGRRRSRSRSPARTTRRSSSRSAAAEKAPPSSREAKPKDSGEGCLSPPPQVNKGNGNSSKHEGKDNNAESKRSEADPDRNQTRYNLRRRKEDAAPEAKSGELQQKRSEEVPAASVLVPLDYGGKIGAVFWLLFLPVWVLLVLLQAGLKDPSLTNFPPPLPPLESLWDPHALGLVLLWILFQALLYILPVGKLSDGMPLHSGQRLKYRTNGFFAAAASLAAVAAAVYLGADLTYIHSHFLQLATASFLVSVLLSVFLYTRSRLAAPEELAAGGNSGNVLYDFFKGRELNPRLRGFDLKFFCEMRPGLLGWCLINVGLALAEMKQQGLPAPSCPMVLVIVFQLLYVLDSLWNEEAVLTTMDLLHEGFGFMLAFGDLVWVPFTYSLQAYYLVGHPTSPSTPLLAASVGLQLVGYYIFRKSNSEKNRFRRDPTDPQLAHLKSIPTATGRSLLVSGWWGVVRHPNYLGDLLMALAWSLPCGLSHLLPWHYLIYFSALLLHRGSRITSACMRTYGSAWEEYCRTVPYRIVPGVY